MFPYELCLVTFLEAQEQEDVLAVAEQLLCCRYTWNAWHWILGGTAILLAFANVFVGLKVSQQPSRSLLSPCNQSGTPWPRLLASIRNYKSGY